jgi:dihydrofolate synthase / folylpolyglutamate synthase
MNTPPQAPASDRILARLMGLHPKIIDLTLGRMHRLLAALGHPERALPPVVHIAGTNGKGSTLAMLRAGLEASGARVHAYTSPHLVRFHERIRLAGDLISEDALSALLDEVEAANRGEPITYFEITTCAALLAFARVPADWLLLEVGLGGRLDATNVVDRPALCVITPVSMDHEQYLGDTLAAIAGEKAGILKPGVPCIVARQAPDAERAIRERALGVGAPLLIEGESWHVAPQGPGMAFRDAAGQVALPLPVLPGVHQIGNAGAAIAGLRRLGLADPAIAEAAVTRAEWPARMQRLRRGPLVEAAPRAEIWLDGGHNPGAGAVLARTLAAMPPRRTHLVCGMLATKDAAGFLRPFAGLVASVTAVAIPGAPATLSAAETAAAATRAGLAATEADSAAQAVARIAAAEPESRILLCGSLYLAGAILAENG